MTENRLENPALRSFGRIKARSLKPSQERLFETLLPSITADCDYIQKIGHESQMGHAKLILEIGFGGGEHLAGQAINSPDCFFIGCEPFLNGVGSALRHISERNINNIRICASDARDHFDLFADECLDHVYILFADPWPKARHHKRRLIQDDFIQHMARMMKPNARLRFATDWADYANWTLKKFIETTCFEWRAEHPCDWLISPPDHLTTRYESKALGDCAPVYFDFYKKS